MVKTFLLKGLNKGWKSGGFPSIYATVEYGKEDWFHASFDPKYFSEDRLQALFKMFNESEDNIWHDAIHNVSVKFDAYSSSMTPINPIIKELFLDLELKPNQ